MRACSGLAVRRGARVAEGRLVWIWAGSAYRLVPLNGRVLGSSAASRVSWQGAGVSERGNVWLGASERW